MPTGGTPDVIELEQDTGSGKTTGAGDSKRWSLQGRRLRLGPTALATLAALLSACVEQKGCGWTHAYAIAKQMHLSYRPTRLALSAFHDLGLVERRKREVDGRLRVEYRLTSEGKKFAVESLRNYFAKRPVVAATKERTVTTNNDLSNVALVKAKRG